MNQQVIKELIELIGGGIHVDFKDDPIRIRLSPHSIPKKVASINYDHNGVYLLINGEEKKWSEVSEEVKNSVTQRLRLIVHQKQIAK
jgi:hypothetical protein